MRFKLPQLEKIWRTTKKKNDSEKYVLKDNFRHFLDLISWDLRCLNFFESADITVGHRCPSLRIKGAAVKGSQSHSQAYYKYLHPVMIEALRRGLGYY